VLNPIRPSVYRLVSLILLKQERCRNF